MFSLCRLIFNPQKNGINKFQQRLKLNSLLSTTAAEINLSNVHEEAVPPKNTSVTKTKSPKSLKPQNSMVAAAFASLHAKEDNSVDIKTPFTDEKIKRADTVHELLSISEGTGVSRKHALKVVSVLAEWTTTEKIKLADFESDPRFLKLCKVLTKGAGMSKPRLSTASRSEDLSTILSVTADDEAAKLVSSITLSQMVKVMSTLSLRKRRSTLLLRALAYNITSSSEHLDLKQSGDLLYSMSSLNFPDENLLTKVANDICLELERIIKKSAVIGSIFTSVGLLKYKNPALLDAMTDWVLNNHSICRPQDVFSMFMSLAVLNYIPLNSDKIFEVLVPQLTQVEAGNPVTWLEIVWSLVLLNQAKSEHVSSVLNESFLEGLRRNNSLSSPSINLKVLNINAAAENLIKDYNGPVLPADSSIRQIKIAPSKQKIEMVDSIIDSLKTLIHTDSCIKTKINTGMGFFIDALCLLDKKCNPLPVNDLNKNTDSIKIAILAHDYHDMCRGRVEATGINAFAANILEAKNYKVLVIPYTDFKPRDKIVRRVQFIEPKLKEIVNSS